MRIFQYMDKAIGAILEAISSACLVLLLLIVGFMVLNRFAELTSLGWTDEIVELLFAWMVFIGAAAVWRKRSHFFVDAVIGNITSPAKRSSLECLVAFLNLLFLSVLAYLGWSLTMDAGEMSPVFQVSKAYWYGVMPIAFLLMSVYCVRDICVALKNFNEEVK
jgi:TRAP-type C4-dicarboxylate transport system permease small subunit